MLLRLCQPVRILPQGSGRLNGLTCVFLALGVSNGMAAERTPPFPVPRPRFEAPAQAPQAPPASTVPKTAPDQPKASVPALHDPYVRLGEYPRDQQREILRRCAAEWDRKKRDGTTIGVIWRDFLGSCLPDR
jgi:hypothetical protein